MSHTLVAIPGVLEAIVKGAASDGRPLVVWGEGRESGVPTNAIWTPRPIDWSLCRGLRALIGFMEGDQTRPVLLGLLDEPPAKAFLAPDPETRPLSEKAPRTLRLQGQEEIVIECGKARIQLRADGTVMVLGERVLSRSKGINRIKGGAVQIN